MKIIQIIAALLMLLNVHSYMEKDIYASLKKQAQKEGKIEENRKATIAKNAKTVLETKQCPGCDLQAINFTRQDLTGADLRGANLTDCNFQEAKMQKAHLENTNLSGNQMIEARLDGADLSNAQLVKTNLWHAILDNATLSNADLTNANLDSANCVGTDLTGANLAGAKLTGTYFPNAKLQMANLTGANIFNAQFISKLPNSSDLGYADLSGATWIDGKTCELGSIGTCMHEGFALPQFLSADIKKMNFVKADLSKLYLSNLDFSGIDLTQANLSEANLAGANLTNANLTQANLKDADITGALLDGAILTGATWIDGTVCTRKSIGTCTVVPPNAHPSDYWAREYNEDTAEWYSWTEVKAPSWYVGTCWPGSLLHRDDACNDWCGRGNWINAECSENKTYCKCKESISPGTDNIFTKISRAAQSVIQKTNDTFKNLGDDMNKGFSKLGACMEVAALSAERAAKKAALETVLSRGLTETILNNAQEAAIQPLIGARKTAEGTLSTAQAFLEKVAHPIATGSIEAARQTASGTLTAGEVVSTGVLTGVDETVQAMLNTFDIQNIRYKGSLQEFASGNLGNVTCKGIIAKQSFNINFDLNVKDATKSVKNLANKIADTFKDLAKQGVNFLQKGARSLNLSQIHVQDDVIKLTMWHHIKKHSASSLLALNK